MTTMISVDFRDRRPIYEQLVSSIKHLVMTGVIVADEQLPSVRVLAAELGINPNTIQKAYTELERQEVTYTISGKGCFATHSEKAILEEKMQNILERCEKAGKEAAEMSFEFIKLEEALYKGYYGGERK